MYILNVARSDIYAYQNVTTNCKSFNEIRLIFASEKINFLIFLGFFTNVIQTIYQYAMPKY